MNGQYGYLYVRTNESYEKHNICKVGITSNIPERDNTYVTNEFIRGTFVLVFEVPFRTMKIFENLVHTNFRSLHKYENGGTEFFDKQIINLIEPFLISLKTKFRKLTSDEIKNMTRKNRVRASFKKINAQSLIKSIKACSQLTQRNYQTIIINKIFDYFHTHNKGLLVMACGCGKTLIALWTAQILQSNTVIIGVPNKLLLKQWEKYVRELFNLVPILIVSNGTTKNAISAFLEQNKQKCIVITTYASSNKVYKATSENTFVFDLKINDEVHHLTSTNINEQERNTFVKMLKINTRKQLSLTATLKLLENNETTRDDDIIVSNDNVEYFGDIIDRKSLLWGINEQIICDYVVQTIVANEEQLEFQLTNFNITNENDKQLFLSAIVALKSISCGHSHHLLIYANNKENIEKLEQYIKILRGAKYFDIDVYCSKYHSDMKSKYQREILDMYNKSTFGIIACVYCLAEGYDNNRIDAVVFSENMCSNIRILQSALRSIRKNTAEPNKITKIILPILDVENETCMRKIREIIYQMGLEDETINQKIKAFKITAHVQKTPYDCTTNYMFGECDNELIAQIKLRTVKRLQFTTTYEKAKLILASKHICSLNDYQKLCESDVRLPADPCTFYNTKFIGWIDYLGIQRIYYELDICRNKTHKYLLLHPEIKRDKLDPATTCEELCKLDCNFPPFGLWTEYYKIKKLQNIIKYPKTKKKKGLPLIS